MTTKAKDKIAKPVYFNIANEKEKEIVDWIENKFSSFGGLVKDLLYKEMLREKNGIQPVKFLESVEETEIPLETNFDLEDVIVEPNDVADFDC